MMSLFLTSSFGIVARATLGNIGRVAVVIAYVPVAAAGRGRRFVETEDPAKGFNRIGLAEHCRLAGNIGSGVRDVLLECLAHLRRLGGKGAGKGRHLLPISRRRTYRRCPN